MPYETIIYDKKEGMAIITLNRPQRLNALSRQLTQELGEALTDIEQDENIKVFVITGAPRTDGRPCFCAGADLREVGGGSLEAGANIVVDKLINLWKTDAGQSAGAMSRIARSQKISIAAIDGVCTAGGLELALSCDMRLVSETAQISDLHLTTLGIIGGGYAATRLARLVGTSKAKELNMTGDTIDGKEAWRIGFANRVFPPDKLLEGAKEIAQKVARQRSVALRIVKAVTEAAVDLDEEQALRYDSLMYRACGSPSEAAQAFVEKRAPVWTD